MRRLSARLGGAPSLHYDDYEQITKHSPAEVEAWLERGAPADEVPLPNFAQAIADLKQGPARHVILDFLLARAHAPTARHIDLLIWIETPLDIALVRTLRDQVGLARAAPPAAGFIDWLSGYLDSYARVMHRGISRSGRRAAASRYHPDGMLPRISWLSRRRRISAGFPDADPTPPAQRRPLSASSSWAAARPADGGRLSQPLPHAPESHGGPGGIADARHHRVGEATIPRWSISYADESRRERVHELRGHLKLAIRFDDWYRPGTTYWHPFGSAPAWMD